MEIIENILLTTLVEQQVGQASPSEVINWLIRIGYLNEDLKKQKTFDAAVKDLINQIKQN